MSPVESYPTNQVENAYRRFSGPRTNISSVGSGPNYMSLKDSALERYEAEKAVRDRMVLEDRKRAEEERRYKMSVDPMFRAQETSRETQGQLYSRITDKMRENQNRMFEDQGRRMQQYARETPQYSPQQRESYIQYREQDRQAQQRAADQRAQVQQRNQAQWLKSQY